MIGDDVEICIVDIRGDKVRLGVTAPRTVSVHRKEVYDAIKEENRSAAQVKPADVERLVPAPNPFPRAVREQPMPETSDPFLQEAINEAKLGLKEGGLPIGSVLVRDGKVIARGHNRRVQNKDPMAHAEIDCLTRAGRQKTYKDCVLYSTLMPCWLCTGAVLQFGIPKVVIGEDFTFPGGQSKWGLSRKFLEANGVEVVDLHDPECVKMMQDFIAAHPELWNEDIGVD